MIRAAILCILFLALGAELYWAQCVAEEAHLRTLCAPSVKFPYQWDPRRAKEAIHRHWVGYRRITVAVTLMGVAAVIALYRFNHTHRKHN